MLSAFLTVAKGIYKLNATITNDSLPFLCCFCPNVSELTLPAAASFDQLIVQVLQTS